MIKKLLSVLVLVFALSGSVLAQQSMSDQQVLEYVKTGMQQGKDQRQIATELARRGVTPVSYTHLDVYKRQAFQKEY